MRFRATTAFLILATLGEAAGCASTGVDVTKRAGKLPKPERVQVRDFAVTASDVELDRGLGPGAMRAVSGELTSNDERRIGRAASEALASALVAKLREFKIPAERARRAAAAGPKTLVIVGRFVTLDEGNQTMRTLVGFGAGASEVRTEARAYMAGQLVAEADTVAKSGKKPGAGVTLGAGAVAGTAATAAGVAAGTTGISEGLLTSVQADARRTGEELARRIRDAYQRRGWL